MIAIIRCHDPLLWIGLLFNPIPSSITVIFATVKPFPVAFRLDKPIDRWWRSLECHGPLPMEPLKRKFPQSFLSKIDQMKSMLVRWSTVFRTKEPINWLEISFCYLPMPFIKINIFGPYEAAVIFVSFHVSSIGRREKRVERFTADVRMKYCLSTNFPPSTTVECYHFSIRKCPEITDEGEKKNSIRFLLGFLQNVYKFFMLHSRASNFQEVFVCCCYHAALIGNYRNESLRECCLKSFTNCLWNVALSDAWSERSGNGANGS